MVERQPEASIRATQSIESKKRQIASSANGDVPRASPTLAPLDLSGDHVVHLEVEPVERVRLRHAVELDHGTHRADHPAAPGANGRHLPPLARAREHPHRFGLHAVVDPRQDLEHLLVGLEQPSVPQSCHLRAAQCSFGNSMSPASDAQAVAEPRIRYRPRSPKSIAIGSPRWCASASCLRINAVRAPRRRCVGKTPTAITPAVGTCGAPGPSCRTGTRRLRRRSAPRRRPPASVRTGRIVPSRSI